MLCVHFEITVCWVVTIQKHGHTLTHIYSHTHTHTRWHRQELKQQIVAVRFSGVGRLRPRLGKQVLSVRPAVEMTDK